MFPDVPVRTDKRTCAGCRKPLGVGDRIVEVKIVAGVGHSPQHFREVVWASDYANSEVGHADCKNPRMAGKRNRIMISGREGTAVANEAIVRARSSDTQCVCCEKKYKRGDRIVTLFIVEGGMIDPETRAPTVRCSGDYEAAHYRCDDPQMTGARRIELT